MVCAEEKVWRCIPIFSSWLADHMENVNIHGIKTNQCPICVVSPSQLGILLKLPYNHRFNADYERLYQVGDSDRYANYAISLKHSEHLQASMLSLSNHSPIPCGPSKVLYLLFLSREIFYIISSWVL